MALRYQMAGNSNTVIGKGTVLHGVLNIKHSIQVYGTLQSGQLATEKTLIVEEEGSVQADAIKVDEAIINGKVSGKLRARQRVYMAAQAVFAGQLETPVLVVEEGAVLIEQSPSDQ